MGLSADTNKRWRAALQAETDSAYLYKVLAELEGAADVAELYRRLGETEERHAEHWRLRLADAGDTAAAKPSARARTLGWLARRFGSQLVLSIMIQQEDVVTDTYSNGESSVAARMARDEQAHGRILRTIRRSGTAGMEGPKIARVEGRHHGVGGNALRAAVLGANDGLVSNLSLVMGVAGAAVAGPGILITGLAGLLAGAISMALGEWLSVQSSRELFEQQLAVEAEELAVAPEEEREELALIYQAKGLPREEATTLAARLLEDDETALDTLAREELGIDPNELGGSAWVAASTSFILFALGAVIPVLPFMFTTSAVAIPASLAVSAIGLFGIGAAITLLTGRSVWYSGIRQTAFGLGAAAITYGIGWLLGAALTG